MLVSAFNASTTFPSSSITFPAFTPPATGAMMLAAGHCAAANTVKPPSVRPPAAPAAPDQSVVSISEATFPATYPKR